MADNGVLLENRGHCSIITINRPEKLNTFDADIWSGLEQAVARLRAKLPRVIIVTGAGGRAFSAGFDVSPANPQVASLIESIRSHVHEPVERLIRYIRTTVDSLVTLPAPVIACINGLAYGGGAELAARCDLRVMDPGASICFSEVSLGLMPDWGGGVALARLVGRSRAADLILTARTVGAEEALALGLVNRISRPGTSLADSLEMAETIAKNGPRAIRAALEVIRRAMDIPPRDAQELETMMASDLITSGECIHGITAFMSKKDPEFPDPQ